MRRQIIYNYLYVPACQLAVERNLAKECAARPAVTSQNQESEARRSGAAAAARTDAMQAQVMRRARTTVLKRRNVEATGGKMGRTGRVL